MVFDTFIRLSPAEPVVLCWPELELPAEQH